MNVDRLMYLLKNAVDHIEAFEEDESENVLKSLGFTDNDLAALRFEPKWDDKDKENIYMVVDKVFHHGEVIWELNYAGNEYIFSDFGEDDSAPDGYVSENVPFKNYSHYFYYDEDRDVYCGYAYYGPTESYVQDFHSLEECLEWLVPDRKLSQVNNEKETDGDFVVHDKKTSLADKIQAAECCVVNKEAKNSQDNMLEI